MSIKILTAVGRLVAGHPMVANPVKDKAGVQKFQRDGVTPQTDYYAGLAIPKGAETDWKLTPWGQQIVAQATADWPNGESGAPTFAWKITDGDSQVPNRKGKKPCEREGWPGHWVINISNGFPFPCYHTGHFQAHEVIQDKDAIKCGDYVRFEVEVKGNGPSESPGVYVNPTQMEVVRAGIQIVTQSVPDANAAFGSAAAVVPANALVDTAVAAPAPAAAVAPAPAANGVAPAPDFLNPVVADPMRVTSTGNFAESALRAANWTPEAIAALPLAQ